MLSREQLAYTQQIKKEFRITKEKEKDYTALYKDIIDQNPSNNIYKVLRKDDELYSTVKLGKTLHDVDFSKTKLRSEEDKENERVAAEMRKLEARLMHKQEPGEDKKTFDKKAFYNQKLSKEIYKFPLKSSDMIGWRSPIDTFKLGNYKYRTPDEAKIMMVSAKKKKK